MIRISRIIFVGLAVSFLGLGSTYALANYDKCGHGRYDPAKIAAWHQKRQTELHARLKLTSQQEDAWKAYVEATTPNDPKTKPDWKELSKLTTIERLEHYQASMKQREDRLTRIIAATKTFYATLNPEQQKIFDAQFSRYERSHARQEKSEPKSKSKAQ